MRFRAAGGPAGSGTRAAASATAGYPGYSGASAPTCCDDSAHHTESACSMMDCNAPLRLPERMSASSRPAKAAAAAMRDYRRICRQKRPLALCCTGRTKSSVSPSRADRLGGMSEWPGQPRRSGNFGDHTASPRRSPQRLHPAGRFRNDGVGRAGRDGSTEAGWQSGLVLRDGGVNVPQ